jgi:hypothetical protein
MYRLSAGLLPYQLLFNYTQNYIGELHELLSREEGPGILCPARRTKRFNA